MYPLVNDKLRETKHKISLVVTGGGASCIDDILKYGGASSTLIDSYVPYDTATMDKYLGFAPDKYCAPETSRLLAMEAFKRATEFHDAEWSLGVGVTCKLKKIANEREGREHAVYIAIQGLTSCTTYTILMGPTADTERNQNLGRTAEEKLAGDAIVMAIADSFGHKEYGTMLVDTFGKDLTVSSAIESKSIGEMYLEKKDVHYYKSDKEPAKCIFSGSFNPIHDAHLAMIKHCKGIYGSVDVELPIINAEKGGVDYTDLRQRIEKIERHIRSGAINNLVLTRFPKFANKSEYFKDVTFAVGGDTFNRIDDDRFYGNTDDMTNEAMANMCKQAWLQDMDSWGTKLLVFRRKGVEFATASEDIMRLTTFVSDEVYQDCGLSSTQIREDEKAQDGV